MPAAPPQLLRAGGPHKDSQPIGAQTSHEPKPAGCGGRRDARELRGKAAGRRARQLTTPKTPIQFIYTILVTSLMEKCHEELQYDDFKNFYTELIKRLEDS